MNLLRAILLRLGASLLSLVFISFVTFVAVQFAPGDAVDLIAGDKATPQIKQEIRHEYGFDQPWPKRYAQYLGAATHLDFGRSYIGIREPVSSSIGRTLPMTVRLAFWAILLAVLVGVSLGTVGALYAGSWIDRFLLGLTTLGVTIPNFVLAPILMLIFAVQLDKLPLNWTENRVAPDFYYLVLPVVVLSLRPMATLARISRASMMDVLRQEYMRLATAKGLPPSRRLIAHGLRNAMLPVLTGLGTSFGFLLTGSFIVETAFTLPGIGRLAIEAISKRDLPVIQGTTLVAGGLFLLVNLLVDAVQTIVDPRIRESQI